MTARRLLKTADVMDMLQWSKNTVLRHAAELGAIRVGRDLRFDPDLLDAYLERQRVKPALKVVEPERLPVRTVATGEMNPLTRQPYGATATGAAGRGRS